MAVPNREPTTAPTIIATEADFVWSTELLRRALAVCGDGAGLVYKMTPVSPDIDELTHSHVPRGQDDAGCLATQVPFGNRHVPVEPSGHSGHVQTDVSGGQVPADVSGQQELSEAWHCPLVPVMHCLHTG
jgi:hypothetical protein